MAAVDLWRCALPLREVEDPPLLDRPGRSANGSKRQRNDPTIEPIPRCPALSRKQWLPASPTFTLHDRNGNLPLKQSA